MCITFFSLLTYQILRRFSHNWIRADQSELSHEHIDPDAAEESLSQSNRQTAEETSVIFPELI